MAEQMSVCFSGRSQAALGLSLSVGFLLIFFFSLLSQDFSKLDRGQCACL